jgi:hypothetical protein
VAMWSGGGNQVRVAARTALFASVATAMQE